MKKLLERQMTFNLTLKVLAFFAKRKWSSGLTRSLTHAFARLNLILNRPQKAHDVEELAHTWQKLMPPDGQEYFKIRDIDEKTAFTEIHLHCPLRGTGRADSCYKLMNYDRQLMEKVGGQLIVLESQSDSGKNYCKIAIRKMSEDASDLIPAHKK